jgi:hypothetical protein|tara:strand:+ start:276 stop:476 length:201 start_codon:yes stop_codon:yes gene_type:complete
VKVGDLVQWVLTDIPPRWGIIVDLDDERMKALLGAPEDQATIQVMWTDMKINWECPLDIEVINENR